MLKIKNLTATIENKHNMLDDINLEVKKGEIHAIIGPEESGKSALVNSIMLGLPPEINDKDSITFNRKIIDRVYPSERSKLGIFGSFQYPPDIPNITNFKLITLAAIAHADKRTLPELRHDCEAYTTSLMLPPTHLDSVGGDTVSIIKKNEILLMLVLNPKLILLDEIDVGLSDEDIVLIGKLIKAFLNKTKAAIIVTNSHALLDILNPTHVHVMVNGAITLSGSSELYHRIIQNDYSQFS